jgi:electron transfer flavoprotein alpha subunit
MSSVMSNAIVVILQQREGKLHRGSWEAIAAAQRFAAGSPGATVDAIVLGVDVGAVASEVASKAALRAVHKAQHAALESYTPGAYRAALAPALRALGARWIFLPHTYQTVDYMARLAHDLGAGLLPEVVGFEAEGGEWSWRRPVLGGKMQARVRVRGEGPMLVSVQSGAFAADAVVAGQSEVTDLAIGDVATDRELLGVEDVGGDTVDLSKAEVIVAAGRGVGGADKMAGLQELAKVLGAEIGASRPVIDSGWLPRDRQIGSSGQTVAPKLYLAFGISGAIQHLVGMKGSSCIVAINKDPGAPIFNVAQYGIAADLHEVIPALTAAVKEAKGS